MSLNKLRVDCCFFFFFYFLCEVDISYYHSVLKSVQIRCAKKETMQDFDQS